MHENILDVTPALLVLTLSQEVANSSRVARVYTIISPNTCSILCYPPDGSAPKTTAVFSFFLSGSRAAACGRRYQTSAWWRSGPPAFISRKSNSAHPIAAGGGRGGGDFSCTAATGERFLMADVNRRGTGLFQGRRSGER